MSRTSDSQVRHSAESSPGASGRDLSGTVALVTGATSGIGEATALRLAERGAAVALIGRRNERLKRLEARIAALGVTPHSVQADVSIREEAFAAVDSTLEAFDRLDTLVNAAGVMYNAPSDEIPIDDWETMVDTNLKGVLYMVKAAIPHLLSSAQDGPRGVTDVVNISSIGGRFARATVAVYNATKFGVTAATEAWRQEFTKRGIRFSVIEPGVVATELLQQREYMSEYAHTLTSGMEPLLPEDIADAVDYIITSPRRVAIAEVVLRPTDQV